MEESTILGLAGLVVSALTVGISYLWNYKTRASPHREFLYQKQIDAYVEFSSAVSRSISPCHDFLTTRELTPENRKEFAKMAEKAYDDLLEQFRKSLVILPIEVTLAINVFLLNLVREVPKLDSAKQIAVLLIDGEWGVYTAIRKNAGIEPIGKELRHIFGEH